jgi:hypothetical protein
MACLTLTISSSKSDFDTSRHIATVTSFINRYKDNPGKRTSLFETFLQYLIAACYKKMSKRVRQWSFIGVLYHLHAVPDEHVQLVFDQYHVKDLVLPAETPTSVNILGRYLSPEVIPFIIDNYPGGRESMSLSTLSAKLSAREVNIYDGTTCVEFHKLLIATLIGYAKSLRIVDPQTKVVHAVTAVYGYALLL